METGVVDPWGRHAQRSRVGAVVGEQVVGLERRRSDDAIGLGDHLVFGGNPEERLGGLVVTPVEVLQPPQRVEGVGQRAIDTTLDQETGPAREPVVGVDDVHRGQVAQDPQCAFGEATDETHQAIGGQGSRRAGIDVVDRVAGHDRHLCRQLRVVSTGEHVDGHSRLGHSSGELVDVHVHAPGVADPRLEQRRRVHGEVGNAADHDDDPGVATISMRGRERAPRRNL